MNSCMFKTKFFWCCICLMLLPTVITSGIKAEEKLAIYVPGEMSSRDVQQAFASDPVFKGVKVLAFGSFEDFQLGLVSEDFNYVLVPGWYLQFFHDVKPIYQLTGGGQATFHFSVISLTPEWDKARLKEGIIGVVNLVGRDKTKSLVNFLLDHQPVKRIKQVSRGSEIYPLLALGNAQYALVTPQNIAAIKAEFALSPMIVSQSVAVPYPVIGSLKSKGSATSIPFSKISTNTLKLLGVDGIRNYN